MFQFKDFEHEPLPTPSSIRLLRIVKRRRGTAGPSLYGKPLIEVELNTVDLNDSPTYKAMSYTWGSPFCKSNQDENTYDLEHKWPLAINGRLTYIGRNLYEALSHFFPVSATKEYAVDQRFPPYNKTGLIQAAEDGRNDLVVDFLERDADIHSQDAFGETALHYAAENGHLDVVKTLISYGASCRLTDKAGRSPLACCKAKKRRQHEEVSRVLHEPHLYRSRASIQRYYPIGSDVLSAHNLWIDSICINQNDIPERNAQVALMARIYSSAQSVVIWLGPADEETKRVLTALSKDEVSRQMEEKTKPADRETLTERRRLAWDLLAERSWFQRRWIVQELCLATEFEMYCGTLRLEPTPKGLFHLSLRNKQLFQLMSLKLWYGCKRSETLLRRMNEWDNEVNNRRTQQLPPLPGLASLLLQTWGAKSSDPRDTVFALLSMAEMAPSETLGGGKKHQIKADYANSVRQVFSEAGKIFVEAEDTIWSVGRFKYEEKSGILEPREGLSYVQHQPHDDWTLDYWGAELAYLPETSHELPDLPSWVPRFHQPLASTRLFQRKYCASGKGAEISRAIWPSNAAILKISGHCFDTIVQVEFKGTEYEPGMPSSKPNLTAWLDITSRLGKVYPYRTTNDVTASSDTLLRRLYRTLTGNNSRYRSSAEEGEARRHPFRDLLCASLCWGERSKEQCELDLALIRNLSSVDDSELIPTIEEIEDRRDSHQRAKTAAKRRFEHELLFDYVGRALLRTDQGCLGLGPARTRPGDQIWLFAGARVPFVLRPVSTTAAVEGAPGRFQFVGECYVDGIMFGEAVESKTVTFDPIEIE